MSLATRLWLVRPGGNLVFQSAAQRLDLINPYRTQTELIDLLDHLTRKGYYIEVTAVRSDHHDDSGLGEAPSYFGTHALGWGVDCWPLRTRTPGDYLDPDTHFFRQFLQDVSNAPHLMQIGLAGGANLDANHIAAGSTCFTDDGGDHVHIGCHR